MHRGPRTTRGWQRFEAAPRKHTGDGVVKYPLTFTRLIIELPEKVLHLNRLVSAPRPEIALKDLRVTYEAPQTAFAAP